MADVTRQRASYRLSARTLALIRAIRRKLADRGIDLSAARVIEMAIVHYCESHGIEPGDPPHAAPAPHSDQGDAAE